VSSVGGRHAVPGNTPLSRGKWRWAVSATRWRWKSRPSESRSAHWSREVFGTNWARRAGQNAPDLLPEYEATVGSFLTMLRGLEGRLEGDPRKESRM